MLKFMLNQKTGKLRKTPMVVIILLAASILSLTICLNSKSADGLIRFTEDSIRKELISVALSAVELLDIPVFDGYNSPADIAAEQAQYDAALQSLRALAGSVGAGRIYVLKKMDGSFPIVFDTGIESGTAFSPYALSHVHREAFYGIASADVGNVQGSFNTAAVPIYYNSAVIGILCVEMEDQLLQASLMSAKESTLLLICSLSVALGALLAFLVYLLKNIDTMQTRLQHLAHSDTVTGLPNRLYLLEYLDDHMKKHADMPFAIAFIDLDNFKRVNDQSGHDAGDELLHKFAQFLARQGAQTKTFHPAAGSLNVSARVGGDEFIQIYPGASAVEDGEAIARELFQAFKTQHISRYIQMHDVSFSMGIALYPCQAESYHVLIKYADVAMYAAKKSGKNQYRVYQDGMAAGDK